MTDRSSTPTDQVSTKRWTPIGPGLIVAATGVGAADLVATVIAGQKFGYALLWAVVIGCILKIVLVEGAGRFTLATGRTIYEGWASLGRWTSWYFGPYIVVWGIVYGAAAMAGTGLPLASLFPALSVTTWGILSALIGAAVVWVGHYKLLERVCAVLVGIMFVTVVLAAALTTPNLPDLVAGLVPRIPDGGLVNVLSVAGGVGGTITLAAYGYWVREKGWHRPEHMRLMRLDNIVAYTVTGIFVIATLIVGAELLYSAGIAVETGDEGLLDLSEVLQARYGTWAGTVFLVGFWSAAMSSLIGVWNGVSMMFADFVGQARGFDHDHPQTRIGGPWYKAYILWLTFPPIVLLLLGRPVWLILAYGVLGALFMPFLAITLLWLLNTARTPAGWRNRISSNVAMGLCAVLFAWLAWQQLSDAVAGVL
ncbi:Nramp family divalent metal transporter [Nocardioides panacisoli]|uniref:Nramp family divalent metal transporter n=1 Tax=Nocardioides panacisoli TaxID=627624 RepID=UPI001C630EF9|nr:Nramp family divalent metal transporter [Nocardioides panacisoli]QYJ03261.1 Nramp family divalent metal transporter [Nocardioides panacisoli]